MRLTAILVTCLGLAGAGRLGLSAELSAADSALLTAAMQEATPRYEMTDAAGCRNRLDAVRDIAWRGHGLLVNQWLSLTITCTFLADEPVPVHAQAQALIDFLEPWRLRLLNNADNTPQEEIDFLHIYWRLLNSWGERERADAYFFPELKQRIAAASAVPADAKAIADLEYFARTTYGGWQLQDYIRLFHQWFEQSLGPAHPVTLATLRSLMYGERYLGRPHEALKLADRAVELAVQLGPSEQRLRMGLIAERAQCLAAAGRMAEAMANTLQVRDALLIRDPLPIDGLVRTHYNLAGIALEMGDYGVAIEHAEQSIAYAQRSDVPAMRVEARVPAAIREVARLMLGASGAAFDLKAALAVTEGEEMHIGAEAFVLVQHAVKVADPELLAWASEFMNAYIQKFRTPLHTDRALQPLMRAWRLGGIELRTPEVRAELDRALAGSLTGRSPGTEALTQFSLARHLAGSQPDEAVWLYKRGANALQRLRQGLPTGAAELHRAWLAHHESDLRAFIGLLIDRGRLVEAEQAVLFLRDEEIVEYTRRSKASRAASVQAIAYTRGEAQRNVGFEHLAQRVAQAASAADQRADESRLLADRFRYRDDTAAAALNGFEREVHTLLAPPAAAGTPDRPAPVTTLRTLPPGTARLTTFVRGEAVELVLQRGRSLERVSVAIAREELNRRVQALRVAVGSAQRDAQGPGRALYDLLITPISERLQAAGTRQLQIVPDASLRYVPFAALYDGRHYLAQRFVLSTDVNGSGVGAQSKASAGRGVLALGRSTGDDQHAALPAVERELAAVARWRATIALNQDFTEVQLRRGLMRRPAQVHIASHFELSPAGEDQSYLLLGDGQRLSLTALRQMPWHSVQLALLSACDSAVTLDAGGTDSGRELVGFATALRSAGVRNVLASLWRVPDGATAEWMEMFYAQQARRPAARVSAGVLAQTQRQWLRRHAGTALAHPHYWAAFSWLGTP